MKRSLTITLLGLLVLGCGGSGSFPRPTTQPALSPLPLPALPGLPTAPSTSSADGTRQKVTWNAASGLANELWVYTPASERPTAGWPTILIAPAGSTQFEGMGLGEGDTPEHEVYLSAGFQVVAYELDGTGGTPGDTASIQFAASQSGLANARFAFEYATTVLPTDPKRVFAVGHSSAGNLALLFASHEDRLAGAVSYNSAADGCWSQPEILLSVVAMGEPGFEEGCKEGHPASHLNHLKTPTLLFASRGDLVVSASDIEALVTRHPTAPLELRVMEAGDHYQSMLHDEVPQAIEWMRTRSLDGM